jgi:hypothetical protein
MSEIGVRRKSATIHPSAPVPMASQLSGIPHRWNQSAKATGTASRNGMAMKALRWKASAAPRAGGAAWY